jgi:hypothetical protein
VRPIPILLLALALAGCGGVRGHGTATLWVTRDRGAHVLFDGSVPAGLTAMQALERRQQVTTRYGGRFVQSIDGVQGDASAQRDWFYFVNGIEADVGATEVKLRPGDVEWWDYRSWRGAGMSVPVVVGAYPEPFLHGFEWAKPGPTSVVAVDVPGVARALARQVHGVVAAKRTARNFVVVSSRFPAGEVSIRRFRSGVLLQLGPAAAKRLAHDPRAFAHRYGSGS